MIVLKNAHEILLYTKNQCGIIKDSDNNERWILYHGIY